jgi:hypothetical protein
MAEVGVFLLQQNRLKAEEHFLCPAFVSRRAGGVKHRKQPPLKYKQ